MGEQQAALLRNQAQFLVDRLSQFDDWSLSQDEMCRDWCGHVEPALYRLKQTLAALPDEQPAQGEVRWNEWTGGECPTEWGQAVHIQYADGTEQMLADGSEASWSSLAPGDPDNIVRWRRVRLLAPPAGPAVEELVADMRERAAKVADLVASDPNGDPEPRHSLNKAAAAIRTLPITENRHG